MTSPSSSSITGSAPRVLLLATERWLTTARMALALNAAGCEVFLMGLRRHPAMLTGVVSARFAYHPLNPIASVASAIRKSKPDTVVPVDELAVMHFIELLGTPAVKEFAALAARSLGGAKVLSTAMSRIALLSLAQSAGVGVPETVAIDSPEHLPDAIAELGLPVVLKADSTAGGRGVRVANSLEEAQGWWSRLHQPLSLPRSIWRWLRLNEWTHFRPWLKGRMRGVTAQKFQSGGERTAMAVAHQGDMKAFACFEVAQASKHLGPSTVLRVVDDPKIETALRAVLHKMGATGFCGFDFMLNAAGEPLMIEMNSRPTQLAHLTLGQGKDMVAAYVRTVLGHDVIDRESAILMGSLVALYPQELFRDPRSSILATAHHDVPWESPELVRYSLKPLPEAITKDPRWKW